jgi:hypothetical protein
MNDRIRNITAEMEKTDGATEQSLDKLRAHFGVKLPAEYVEFMRTTNGADGPIGSVEYLQIWPAEEIIELDLLRVDMKEEHPEWLFFGGMGGGSSYAFDTRYQPMPVVEVDMIDPDSNEVRGGAFEEFLENLYAAEE